MKSILVVGGTGFVGKAVCRAAVQRGLRVISLSRKGQPVVNEEQPWMKSVVWKRGDARDATLVRSLLQEFEVKSVIHTVGTLIDAKTAQSVQKTYNYFRGDGQLETRTFDEVNRDCALNCAAAAAEYPKCESFVFMSASMSRPVQVVPFLKRYITAKQQVEQQLSQYPENVLRTVSLRPGIIYDEMISFTHTLAILTAIGLIPFRLIPAIPSPLTPAVHVRVIADSALEAAFNSNVKGIFEGEEINRICQ
eukprot:c36800_g1_i1.p1 GENE.c36800_g1_i1~~c36800_g1_i1.p1  ORF type:complete len:250 (+),score=126.89 c36800_g1_i1:50-799(+)